MLSKKELQNVRTVHRQIVGEAYCGRCGEYHRIQFGYWRKQGNGLAAFTCVNCSKFSDIVVPAPPIKKLNPIKLKNSTKKEKERMRKISRDLLWHWRYERDAWG